MPLYNFFFIYVHFHSVFLVLLVLYSRSLSLAIYVGCSWISSKFSLLPRTKVLCVCTRRQKSRQRESCYRVAYTYTFPLVKGNGSTYAQLINSIRVKLSISTLLRLSSLYSLFWCWWLKQNHRSILCSSLPTHLVLWAYHEKRTLSRTRNTDPQSTFCCLMNCNTILLWILEEW